MDISTETLMPLKSGLLISDMRLPVTYASATNTFSGRNFQDDPDGDFDFENEINNENYYDYNNNDDYNFVNYGDHSLGYERERINVIKSLEGYWGKISGITNGFEDRSSNENSHDCVLRMLCESAMTPQHSHGLFGDLLNLVMTPGHLLSGLPSLLSDSPDADYVAAQVDGRLRGNCTKYAERCHTSLFEIVHTGEEYYPGSDLVAYSKIADPQHDYNNGGNYLYYENKV